MNYNKIRNRVEEHKEFVRKEHRRDGDIFFTALQGSQNYGLDYEGSDIDSKLIIVPSIDDIIFNLHIFPLEKYFRYE